MTLYGALCVRALVLAQRPGDYSANRCRTESIPGSELLIRPPSPSGANDSKITFQPGLARIYTAGAGQGRNPIGHLGPLALSLFEIAAPCAHSFKVTFKVSFKMCKSGRVEPAKQCRNIHSATLRSF